MATEQVLDPQLLQHDIQANKRKIKELYPTPSNSEAKLVGDDKSTISELAVVTKRPRSASPITNDPQRGSRSRTGTPAPKQYICPQESCGKVFNKPIRLQEHLNTHTGERPYICLQEGCGAAFARRDHLNTHKKTHSEEKPYACPNGCGKAFKLSHQLKRHIKACNMGDLAFKCTYPDCEKSFKKHNLLNRHIAADHEKTDPYVCPKEGCGKGFPHPSHLKEHIATHPEERKSNTYVCSAEGCDKVFDKWSAMQAHVKEHAVMCETCGKQCKNNASLREHLKTHLDEQIPCKDKACGRVYKSHKAMLEHYRLVHLHQAKYFCDLPACDMSFMYKSQLARHRNGPHDATLRSSNSPASPIDLLIGKEHSDRKIPCIVEGCQFRFRHNYHLTRHIAKHHPELMSPNASGEYNEEEDDDNGGQGSDDSEGNLDSDTEMASYQ